MAEEKSKVVTDTEDKKSKSKKTIFIVIGVIVGMIFLCCGITAISGAFSDEGSKVEKDDVEEVKVDEEEENLEDGNESQDEVAESEVVKEPEPINISGSGDTVTDNNTLKEGYAVVKAAHSGSSNFILSAIPAEGSETLLVNEIGNYSGKTLLDVSEEQDYMFEITADGSWSLEITQPINATETTPVTLNGKGDDVILVNMKSGNRKLVANHKGESNFVVSINNPEAIFDFDSLVVNEIGDYSGSNLYKMSSEGVVYVEVNADGEWSIEID